MARRMSPWLGVCNWSRAGAAGCTNCVAGAIQRQGVQVAWEVRFLYLKRHRCACSANRLPMTVSPVLQSRLQFLEASGAAKAT